MLIKTLFDSNKNIYRKIEKVINYEASQEERLKAEIDEYVATDSIEDQLRKLLDNMQEAMDGGGSEIGVWVSGFYGSGKSSFTKYLGLAFDQNVKIDGIPFLEKLQNRLHTPQAKAQLAAIARKFPAEVVMVDLASSSVAGAQMEEISTVLYYKVLQWAGYSKNLKVAALEHRIKTDGRWEEFEIKTSEIIPGKTWKDLQNDPLIVDGLLPQIAHDIYPELFPTTESFSSNAENIITFEDQRVREMLDIIRRKNGKEHIIFILDEVGQYVSSKNTLILNLQGLSENLKNIGGGKVWLIATAQQTLTEDSPRAAINAPELYKLKDRFPIQVDLESKDIKEICYKRLLGKSAEGEEILGKMFDAGGQALRHNTKLQDAKFYDSDFTRKTFVDLYPFLPAHFDILLQLLGALAKSTGGIGLRSAIKIVQDILVEGESGEPAAAEKETGWLATTVTLFNSLEKDIQRAFPSIHHAVSHTGIRFPKSQIHAEVAKSVAILQILNNIPVNAQNIAGLMQPSVTAASKLETVKAAIDEMLRDPRVPLDDKDGNLRFLSDKLLNIQKERSEIATRSTDLNRIFNENLREVFEPLPRANLAGGLNVAAGLKIITSANSAATLAGDNNAIQFAVQFAETTNFEQAKNNLISDSRERSGQNTIYLIGNNDSNIDELVAEIYRSQQIADQYRNEPDPEIREYINSQRDREAVEKQKLQHQLKQSLAQGAFVFRGQDTAVSFYDGDLPSAARKILTRVAEEVFSRFSEAPIRVETSLAEKFLKIEPKSLTAGSDPLTLFVSSAGTPKFDTDHKAVVSIRDYVERAGTVDGKTLLEKFQRDPFGWSPDTTRYILAAMLRGGEIKLKISGREVTTVGQQAIEALKNNTSFKAVGVSLRETRPSNETLARAATRLTELLGEPIIPLEQEISQTAVRNFPKFQSDYAPLADKLTALSLAGIDRAKSINQDIQDVLYSDGSDATVRLGSADSVLYENLKWAREVKKEFGNGLEATVREINLHRQEADSLPDSGIPAELKAAVGETLALIDARVKKDDFYRFATDFNTQLSDIKGKVIGTVERVKAQLKDRIKGVLEQFRLLPDWSELNRDEQENILSDLDRVNLEVSSDIQGLRHLLSRDYEINTLVEDLKRQIANKAAERRRQRFEDAQTSGEKTKIYKKSIPVSAKITSAAQIDRLIESLQEIKIQMALYSDVEIEITLED